MIAFLLFRFVFYLLVTGLAGAVAYACKKVEWYNCTVTRRSGEGGGRWRWAVGGEIPRS